MSAETYSDMAWEAYEAKMDRELRQALEDFANGERGQPIDEVFAELRESLLKK